MNTEQPGFDPKAKLKALEKGLWAITKNGHLITKNYYSQIAVFCFKNNSGGGDVLNLCT